MGPDPGFDSAVVRLASPGLVRGVVVDTAHFLGNFPPGCSVDATWCEGYPGLEELAAASWTEIVAPYLKFTNGHYIATGKMPTRFGDEAIFGKTEWVNTLGRGPLTPPGVADLVIVSRNIHDFMWTPGLNDRLLKDFNASLKPGGILAVEEHRADPRPQVKEARDGYVETKVLIADVERAGFKLQAQSEINANPKDTKDHPFGVWTLPPTRRSAQPPAPDDPKFDHAKYDAIGESDRMTLRFVKA